MQISERKFLKNKENMTKSLYLPHIRELLPDKNKTPVRSRYSQVSQEYHSFCISSLPITVIQVENCERNNRGFSLQNTQANRPRLSNFSRRPPCSAEVTRDHEFSYMKEPLAQAEPEYPSASD